MSHTVPVRATIDDLYQVEGKAELINGGIVFEMATGHLPGRVGGRIFRSLADYTDQLGTGEAYPDNVGFVVPELSSGRESFSPDVSYYDGALPVNPMRFIEGAPNLGVEVRSENDYGPAAEMLMAAKRDDYFEAGTQVVWDVDPLAEQVHVYLASNPTRPTTYTRGQMAEAEPAVPGWKVSVDWIFGPPTTP